jgi:hypothetical protein
MSEEGSITIPGLTLRKLYQRAELRATVMEWKWFALSMSGPRVSFIDRDGERGEESLLTLEEIDALAGEK